MTGEQVWASVDSRGPAGGTYIIAGDIHYRVGVVAVRDDGLLPEGVVSLGLAAIRQCV